ncbi:hypothetical protein FO488_19185 [Geobacter sp. FeAm09]|uniref:hypothetical protein n=1 Tax=Geobacter sp. FeAm09 TaxID=2597769 RepID=UPI0011EC268B|nr:hypothetical protein [Geobacter sp. FeAm09]QEM66775.1 hypothetical protein FO488_00440 [Geobacter sp. FeAm09]QEM70066.1 hypothetical protein FO488_19185 [Geobacter sp. FeAm09]
MLLTSVREAGAARLGLLLLGTPQQRVDFTYQFNGQQQATTSQQHQMEEDYTFKIDYGIIRPSLLKGSFRTALRFNQGLTYQSGSRDQSSSKIGFLYDIKGLLLGQSVAPAEFSAKSDITQVSVPFSKSYQVTNTTYNLSWSLKNRMLPFSIEYATGTSETSGLQVDTKRVRDEIRLHAAHNAAISTTAVDVYNIHNTYSPAQGGLNFDNHYEIRLQNDLVWADGAKARRVSSRLQASESTGINFTKNFEWSEAVHWDWGKSLRSGANYSFGSTGGDPGAQKHNTGGAWLQHQLFKSLTTRLDLRARKNDYPTGYDQEINGGVSFNYVKQLPAQSTLSLNGYRQYTLDTRDLGTDRLHIYNEQHTVSFASHLYLAQPNVIASSITVRNADALKRLAPYDLNVDYQVTVSGALTEIVPLTSGAIKDGDSLLISYDYQVDPQLKTTTNAYGFGGNIQFLGGKYRLYGDFSQSHMDRSAGQGQLASLTAQIRSTLGLERKWDSVTLGAEYNSFDSEADKHESLTAQMRYSNELRDGVLSLTLVDQYLWYGPVTTGTTTSRRADENSFTATAGYGKRLFSTTYMTLNSTYINVTGANTKDSLTVGASLRWSLGKMIASLNTSLGLRREGGTTATDETVRFTVSRYF